MLFAKLDCTCLLKVTFNQSFIRPYNSLKFYIFPGDVAAVEHEKHQSRCPFLAGAAKNTEDTPKCLCMPCLLARAEAEPPRPPASRTRKAKMEHLKNLASHYQDICSELLSKIKHINDSLECKVCLTNRACVMMIPCAHMSTCEDCSKKLDNCPICRKKILGSIKGFM